MYARPLGAFKSFITQRYHKSGFQKQQNFEQRSHVFLFLPSLSISVSVIHGVKTQNGGNIIVGQIISLLHLFPKKLSSSSKGQVFFYPDNFPEDCKTTPTIS